MKSKWLVAAILPLSVIARVWATDVKLGGVVYGHYAHQLSDKNYQGKLGKDRSVFGISRIYMIGEAKYSPQLKSKVVLEGSAKEVYVSSGTSNTVFVKNAYGEYTFNNYVSVAFGMIPTPWLGFEEGIWGRRFIQKTAQDQAGVLSSADLGIGFSGKLPHEYGNYHLVYSNGEGCNKDEKASIDGRRKDIMLRVSLVPFESSIAGLKFHGYIHQGRTQDGDKRLRDRYIGGVSYQNTKLHLMYSYLRGHDGDGTVNRIINSWSTHGSYQLPKGFSVFGRYDSFTKGSSSGPEAYYRGIIGVDYKLADGARVSLNDQWLDANKTNSGVNKSNENQLMAQFELKF